MVAAAGASFSMMESSGLLLESEKHWESGHGKLRIMTRAAAHGIRKNFSGWRFGVASWAGLVIVVFFVNLGLAMYVGIYYGFVDGLGTLLQGSCSDIATYNIVAHLIINVLSTLLLSGSNYCMQCLSAPTRREVDKAHDRGMALDIGIPSAKNLRVVDSWKVWMWCLLGISSLPLHLFYNSVIYSSLPANNYEILSVTGAFLEPGSVNISSGIHQLFEAGEAQEYSWSVEVATRLREQALNGELDRLENSACIKAYGQTYLSDRSNLMLVVSSAPTNQSQNTSIVGSDFNDNDMIDTFTGCVVDPVAWMCSSRECESSCLGRLPGLLADLPNWSPYNQPVEYCLSQATKSVCKLHFSLPIAVVIIIFNLAKAVLMLVLAFGLREARIHTVGDAIASFLVKPDDRAKDRSLYGAADIEPNDLTRTPEYLTWVKKRYWFAQAAGLQCWLRTFFLYAVTILACSLLLAYGVFKTPSTPSLSSMLSLRLGVLSTETTIFWSLPSTGTTGLLSSVLIANIPQLILSLVYFAYNSLFTSMLAGLEWSQMAWQKKGLRVSQYPKGNQRSSYFLQLPYRYAIPLLGLSGVMHWLVSQSIFLVAIERYDPLGNPAEYDPVSCESAGVRCGATNAHYTCGWSPVAVLLVICGGVLMMILAIAMGQRRYKAGMPLGGTNSAVIAAACHIDLDDEPEDIECKKIRWGVVGGLDGDGKGHCAFSAREPDLPLEGIWYK